MNEHICLLPRRRLFHYRYGLHRCPSCNRPWFFYTQWQAMEYKLKFLDGTEVWSLWMGNVWVEYKERARMNKRVDIDAAKTWATGFIQADGVEILSWSNPWDHGIWHATTQAIDVGQRALARAEIEGDG